MTKNGLKWLFSVIFRKSIRVHLTRLQMASPGAYLGSLGCVRPPNTFGRLFPIVFTIRGHFQRGKTWFFRYFGGPIGPLKTPWKRPFWVKNSVFALKRYVFFVKSENHPMYTSLQKKKKNGRFWSRRSEGIKNVLIFFFADPQKIGGGGDDPPPFMRFWHTWVFTQLGIPPNGRTRGSELGPVQVRPSEKKKVLFWPRFLAVLWKKRTFFGVPICTWGGFQNDWKTHCFLGV